ncbi:MAG TPA: zinc-dependent metalloprotease [Candidatus Micrarchaeia archaeon]|nr:zinc-dependent metalloprotease [Candidatus Micrarchaeia archaeon]
MADARRLAAISALGLLGAVAAREGLRRARAAAPGSMLDWELVRRTAYARCGEPAATPDAAARLSELQPAYDGIAEELSRPLTDLVGPGLDLGRLGSIAVVDRRGLIDRNIGIMVRITDAIESVRAELPAPWLQGLARVPLSLYVGGLLAFLSRRVLGQYDPVLSLLPSALSDRPTLLVVEPNIAGFAAGGGLDVGQARRWLVLHELTHAWQFSAHPWLGDHLTTLLRGLVIEPLRAAGLAGAPRDRTADPLRLLRTAGRGLAGQWRAIAGLQAVMSVLEGHGNYVMREVGRGQLRDFEQLDAAFHRRQQQRSLLEQLVVWLTGIRAKLQQYERGERFLRAVESAGGPALLARVWSGPDALPSNAELRAPLLWVARMQAGGGPVTAASAPLPPEPAPQPA